jgi:protein SCO1/2
MKKPFLVGALVVLPLLVLGGRVAFLRAPQAENGLRSGTFDPPRDAPTFSLDGSNGMKLSPRDYLGKVVIVEFGYTYCQDVCPITLAHLTEAWKKMGSVARDVQLIYITVDPARDNPQRLREHLTAFNPGFLGATGAPEDLQAVEKAYGVVARQVPSKNPALPYAMDHSSSLYLIDRQGKLRGLVPFGTPVDDIVHDLEFLLQMRA